MLPFEIAEYKERLSKVKTKMAEVGMEVLLITNPSNMNYLSGYDVWSFYVHQMLIVTLDREEPIWVGRGMDASGARMTSWLDPKHIISYTDDYVQSNDRHPMEIVCDQLKQIGKENKTIGVEMDTYYFTALAYATLVRGLPNAKFIDAKALVNWVRIIKSNQEIEYMKKAGLLANQAMAAAFDTIGEGVRECDVVAQIYHSQISGTPDLGGDYPAIVPLLPSGSRSASPHITWSDEVFKKRDPIIVELAGCYKRYHCPMARTTVISSPSDKVKSLSNVVLEGINNTLEGIKPGVTCEEVESIWNDTVGKKGYKKDWRIGYSVGLSYPPDWGEHTASLRKGDKTLLKPNMTFHVITGIWMEDYGVEFSETIRVTDTGYEALSNFPRQLHTNINQLKWDNLTQTFKISKEGTN
jgi:ectoine hydrolase